jgi:hypothetical protein
LFGRTQLDRRTGADHLQGSEQAIVHRSSLCGPFARVSARCCIRSSRR